MKRDTFYFPHDTNARNDPKLIQIYMDLDLSGIGFYWNIIEVLHSEPTSKLTEKQFQDYIKFYYRTNVEQVFNKIQQTFLNANLFVLEDGFICSNRVINNKETRESISDKRSKAGRKSAENKRLRTSVQQKLNKASTKLQQNSTIKGKERRVKESKEEKENKEKKEHPLQNFLRSYPRISSLKEQISFREAETLAAKFSRELIKKTIEAMENYKPLTSPKGYVSVYRTLNKWCQLEIERNPQKQTPPQMDYIREEGEKHHRAQAERFKSTKELTPEEKIEMEEGLKKIHEVYKSLEVAV